ncbi:hypothetical protein KFZ56_16335 [Virgibacillus sp. NKC19-3]|uniref:hypothetical protein n=1 Tax=Virgibacillus saliphilus TaxID=2831674 RepID=UPI001C9AFD0C|nr:hypothetical protein [Virgibacillus sp. NKC19-3]MBY7144590.1 hypothetical protein [Virgibacillus sp. NKC19-3]
MEKQESTMQILLEELNTSLILTDMKSRIVQTMCNLIDDEVYTKSDAVYALLEVVALIELEEKKVKPNDLTGAGGREVH